MASRLELCLLGPPEVRLNEQQLTGFRSTKAKALLYYLGVTGQAHTRLALSGLLWGQWPDSQALVNLSQTLSNLRKLVGDHLEIGRDTIGWNRHSDHWLDVEAVRMLVDTPLAVVDTAILRGAVEQFRGDFLEGFFVHDAPEFEEWMLRERARWREGALQALCVLAERHAALAQHEEAIGLLRRVLALEPWREEVHRQLMEQLALSGQWSAALTQYEVCRRTLAEELAIEPSQETELLYQRIRQGQIEPQAPAARHQSWPYAPTIPPHNLPTQVTPFVGRTEEVAQIVNRLCDPDCRLLTLVGPGGIGKTRLALRAVQQLVTNPLNAPLFADGLFFVSLASVTAPIAIITAIADAVGFYFHSDVPPRQQILNYLQTKQMVLLLDNFEHLLGGVDFVSEILAIAPGVTILITSREALRLREEWFHLVPGMRVPQTMSLDFWDPHPGGSRNLWLKIKEKNDPGISTLAGYDALELFVQNARRAYPSFSVEAEQANVVRICQLVEGSPLAIELAAGWLKVIPCSQIVQEIERNLDILATHLHNVPERHRSMRVVLEQSWELLTPREQAVLKRLAVFRGGFQQEPAAHIANASLLVLGTFIEKSILLVSGDRYHLHELLRQFAEEKLVADAETASTTRTQHSLYYLDLLRRWGDSLTDRNQKAALSAIGAELDNVRVGWQWAVEQQELEVIEQTLDSLYNFYQIRSRYQEGAELLGQAQDRLQKVDKHDGAKLALLLVKLGSRRGALCQYLGEYETAAQWLQEALLQAQALGHRKEIALAHNLLGQVAAWRGQKEVAHAHLSSSLAMCREIGDKRGLVDSLRQLANLLYATYGDYAEAKLLAEESLALSRELGRPDWIAYALDTLGFVTFALGDYDDSRGFYQQGLALFEEIGDPYGMALTLGGIAMIHWALGGEQLNQARHVLERSLAHCRKIGHAGQVSGRLGGLAWVANDQGKYEEALHWGKEGLAIAQLVDSPIYIALNLYCLTGTACGMGDLETARRYLWQGLRVAQEAKILSNLTILLYYYALILAKESELGSLSVAARQQKRVQAVEVLAVVRHHPACWQTFRDRAALLHNQIAGVLPREIVLAAEQRGATHALEDLVPEILGRPPA